MVASSRSASAHHVPTHNRCTESHNVRAREVEIRPVFSTCRVRPSRRYPQTELPADKPPALRNRANAARIGSPRGAPDFDFSLNEEFKSASYRFGRPEVKSTKKVT